MNEWTQKDIFRIMKKIFVIAIILFLFAPKVTGSNFEDPLTDSEDNYVSDDAVSAFAVSAATVDGNSSGGPSVTDIEMATKWLNGIKSEVPNATVTEDIRIDATEEFNKNIVTQEKVLETKISDDLLLASKENESNNSFTSIQNPSVLQLLKEQIQNDFRPIFLVLDYVIPKPMKSFFSAQFAAVSKQLVLILSGAFSPMLSTAAKGLLLTGEALIALSHKIYQTNATTTVESSLPVADIIALETSTDFRDEELLNDDQKYSYDEEIIDEDSDYNENVESTEVLEIVEED